MTELKPCPFCGGKAYFHKPWRVKGTALYDRIGVECEHCGAFPYQVMVYQFKSLEDKQAAAAEQWNRRAK